MGPSMWQKNLNQFLQVTLLGASAIFGLLLVSSPLIAQVDTATSAAASEPQARSATASTPASEQPQNSQMSGSISGTVLDATGAPVAGAQVRLTRQNTTPRGTPLQEAG